MPRAIDRTTATFIASVQEAIPDARVHLQRSIRPHGRSNYVYIEPPNPRARTLKVRISDHAIGMRRFYMGDEDLHLHARARPDRWAVWLSETVKRWATMKVMEKHARPA